MKKIKKIALLSLICATYLNAAGYKIPEQSADSIALSASNVAYSFGADANYYNPAFMPFLSDENHFESAFTYIHLGKTKFTPKETNSQNYPVESKRFDILVPMIHYASPNLNNFRFGLSFVAPGGLTMRWDDKYPSSTARSFALKIFELSPNLAYQINDQLSMALGLRFMYAKGVVKSQADKMAVATIPAPAPFGPRNAYLDAQREVSGDAFSTAWNLALLYKPTNEWNLALTYRSLVKFDIKGRADLKSNLDTSEIPAPLLANPAVAGGLNFLRATMAGNYSGDASLKIVLPAVLTLGTSYEFDKLTLMFAYDRVFWSKMKDIDFEYSGKAPLLFDKPIERNWKDTNTFRVGAAYQATDKLRLMAGLGYDEAPSNNKNIGFELPDTKAYIYSAGLNYKFTPNLDLSLSYLYQDRQKRNVEHKGRVGFDNLVGKFDNGDAQLTSFAVKYRF